MKVPARVCVSDIISSRYIDNQKPLSWDERRDGLDVVRTMDGQVLRLLSDGGQAPPREGWELMLTEDGGNDSYRWTLYGMTK